MPPLFKYAANEMLLKKSISVNLSGVMQIKSMKKLIISAVALERIWVVVMSDIMSGLPAALLVFMSHSALCQFPLCYMDKHVAGFTSATSATSLLFYELIYFHNSGSLNCKVFFSTLAWLRTYTGVQILLWFCLDNILEHQIALCPVFAQCLFAVMCS